MLPQLPQQWVYGNKAPFQEGATVEFKEVTMFSGLFRHKSVGNSGLPKYRETIIGFLNSGAGLLIMGIKNDGTIVGVEDTNDKTMDMFKLWVDSHYNSLVYKNGKSIDPSTISIKYYTYPVINRTTSAQIIVVEAINKRPSMDIMTRSGTVIHRLNASNFKLTVEPIYRKRDVKGMIYAVKSQMHTILADKKRAIEDLQEKHEEEIKRAIHAERQSIRDYVEKISQSLYKRYNSEPKPSLCSKVMCALSAILLSTLT
jgi:hypothetical protein